MHDDMTREIMAAARGPLSSLASPSSGQSGLAPNQIDVIVKAIAAAITRYDQLREY